MLSIPPPQRPPSRSERLLRETLRRDVEVRDSTVAITPQRKSSLSRRSPSRVASPPPPLPALDLYSRPASPGQRCRYAELADEQYAKGNFLIRPAITNAPHSPPVEVFYSHKAESDGTVTPSSRSRFPDGKRPHTSTHSGRLSTRSISPSPPRTMVSRRHSLQRAFYHESLTPQEHALRARLENMLRPESSHMTNPNGEIEIRDSDLTARSGSMSQPQSGASIWSSPPPSAPILHSTSSPSLQDNSFRTHTRSRSSTDPIRSPSHANTHTPPNSITRARTAANTNTSTTTLSSSSTSMANFSPRRIPPTSYPHYPHHPSHQSQVASHQHSRRKHVPIEATPPLTADTSPIGISAGNELEPDYQLDADDDSRLITPPPSPPLSGSSRKSHHHHLPHSPVPYRPTGDWYPAFSVPGSEEEHTVNPDLHSHGPLSGSRPQFNVRKASEQCKLIDGYVSFLSIEGLGGPPESNSPAIGDDESEGDDRSREKRMFGIGWDRWKKLLPLAVVGSNGTAGVHESAESR